MTRRWLKREQAAEYMSVDERTIDRWIREHKLRAYHVGDMRSVRIDLADLDSIMTPVASDDATG